MTLFVTASTTVTSTGLAYATFIRFGVTSPISFTLTGAVTTISLPLIFVHTVTVPSGSSGTFGTVTMPLRSGFFPV